MLVKAFRLMVAALAAQQIITPQVGTASDAMLDQEPPQEVTRPPIIVTYTAHPIDRKNSSFGQWLRKGSAPQIEDNWRYFLYPKIFSNTEAYTLFRITFDALTQHQLLSSMLLLTSTFDRETVLQALYTRFHGGPHSQSFHNYIDHFMTSQAQHNPLLHQHLQTHGDDKTVVRSYFTDQLTDLLTQFFPQFKDLSASQPKTVEAAFLNINFYNTVYGIEGSAKSHVTGYQLQQKDDGTFNTHLEFKPHEDLAKNPDRDFLSRAQTLLKQRMTQETVLWKVTDDSLAAALQLANQGVIYYHDKLACLLNLQVEFLHLPKFPNFHILTADVALEVFNHCGRAFMADADQFAKVEDSVVDEQGFKPGTIQFHWADYLKSARRTVTASADDASHKHVDETAQAQYATHTM